MAASRRPQCRNSVIVPEARGANFSALETEGTTTMRTLFLTTAAFAAVIVGFGASAKAATTGEVAKLATTRDPVILLDDIASHGPTVRNPDWLDRPGSYAILNGARAARVNDKAKVALIK